MIKKLVFTAALLAPGLAYAATPVPSPASAAGFTKLAFESDFTQPFYANKANWLDCGGATSPQWFQGYIGVEYTAHAPCSNIGQGQDPAFPTGPAVLNLHWDDTQYQGAPGVIGTMIEPTDTAGHNGPFWTFYYLEIVARFTPLSLANFYSLWSVAQNGFSIEFDGLEVASSSTDSNACIHNDDSGASQCIWFQAQPPTFPGGIDYTQYHTYAWRVTSDGSTDVYWCMYIDGATQGCQSVSPTADQIAGGSTVATTIQLLNTDRGASCPGRNAPCGVTGDMYVKSVRVWTCPAWSIGNPLTHCYSSRPNP